MDGQLFSSWVMLSLHIARNVTRQLGKLMDASGLFSVVRWDYSNQPKAFFELYFPLRYRFISPNLRPYLDKDDGYKSSH